MKKDWLYSVKLNVLIITLMFLGVFSVMNLFLTRQFINDSLAFCYQFTLFIVWAYPVLVLNHICKREGEPINILPDSNRQLLWKGLKPWIIFYPCYVVVSIILVAGIQAYVWDETVIGLMKNQAYLMLIATLLFGSIVLQIMSAMIQMKMSGRHWSLPILLISTGIIILITIAYQYPSGSILSLCIYFAIGIAIFTNSLKDIEKIYQ